VRAVFRFPALRTGLFKLNHIRGFEEKILKGFNMNNRPDIRDGKLSCMIQNPEVPACRMRQGFNHK
jgi:hypothetical protein